MTQTQALADRLTEVLLSGHWIANTHFKAQIEQLSREQATQKIGSLNTIAALTYSLNYYLAGIIHVFQGGELEIRDKYSFNLPPIGSESDWRRLVEEFVSNASLFVEEDLRLPESKLDEPFTVEKYGTYLRNIEGVIEHSYYHLGQVVLLSKLVTKRAQ